MCHSITWYYARCVHPDPHSTSLIACVGAFKKGYECTEEHQAQISFARKGLCPECKMDTLALRKSILRKWDRDPLAALNDAFQYHEGDWSIDESDGESDEETDFMRNPTSQSSHSTSMVPTNPVESCALFYNGPVGMPTRVQPRKSQCPSSALVDYADGEKYDQGPLMWKPELKKTQDWRSCIPLPTRLLQDRQTPSYMRLVSDDEISDTEPLLGTSRAWDTRVSRSLIPRPINKTLKQ